MSLLCYLFLILLFFDDNGVVGIDDKEEVRFDEHYKVIMGDHDNYVLPINQGRQVQLTMDNSSGSFFSLQHS